MKTSAISGILVLTLLLVSCGGGDGVDGGGIQPPTPEPNVGTAQGFWAGKTASNRTITGMVLGDGTYYILYSVVNNPALLGGVVQGTGVSNAGAFTSSNTRDFNVEGQGVLSGSVSAIYVAKKSFNGTIVYPQGGGTTFTSAYEVAAETTPTLATLAGTYTGQVVLSAGVQNAVLAITPSGQVVGAGDGCELSGTASPRSDVNAYNLAIRFGPAPCFFANQAFTGAAYLDASNKRLYAAAPNGARTNGVLFIGTKP